jgi:hypothetical protein
LCQAPKRIHRKGKVTAMKRTFRAVWVLAAMRLSGIATVI